MSLDEVGLQALNGLSFGALLFLLASGFTMVFGLMQIVNLAHGAFYLVGNPQDQSGCIPGHRLMIPDRYVGGAQRWKAAVTVAGRLQTAGRPSRFPPPWTLRLPPSRVLERVPGDPDAPRVVLVAAGPGTVRLLLVKRVGCAPPLRCPVGAADPTGQGERMRPPLAGVTVAITVRVR